MDIHQLLSKTNYIKTSHLKDVIISGISFDSRKTKKNDIFVAIDGADEDGHKYIDNAIQKGVAAIVITKEYDFYRSKYPQVATILVEDSRIFLAQSSALFFDYPSKNMNIIGITGTKGKSTISYMIKNIFDKADLKSAVIGTIGISYNNKLIETNTTTPSSYELNQIFSEIRNEKISNCIMEVSSISMKMNRVYGLHFNIGMYTNLTQAHITQREHPTFEDYYNSKKLIFEKSEIMLVNIDDDNVEKALNEYLVSDHYIKTNNRIISIGIDKKADITAKNILYKNDKSSFIYKGLNKCFDVLIDIPGRFNIYNSLFAITAALLNDVDIIHIQNGLSDVQVRGRCEKVDIGKDYTMMIDYAHTPDSLLKILQAVRETKTSGRIITLFGCGGDRDKSMRPMMGKISGENSDLSIITSDNSRTEKPEKIISMIEDGIKQTNGQYICITDRTEAIRYAMKIAKKDDIVILAGKGNETYLDVMGVKTHYDEREIIYGILEGRI